jgi:hypothetical protein
MTPVNTLGNFRGSRIASVIGITYTHLISQVNSAAYKLTHQSNTFKRKHSSSVTQSQYRKHTAKIY